MKTVRIDRAAVNAGLWLIQRYLMQRYGVDESERDIAPLVWYVETGRACPDFIRAVLTVKPFMVARKLHEGGTYDDAIKRVKNYLMNHTEYTDI